ncbi:MAG: DinB family protein [Ignavibacteriae bacterium]|nr:DinB family protein [Ignavibacteriota bacterium]
MTEAERIAKSFEDLFNGNPGIFVTLVGTLENITHTQASARPYPKLHSIWEIVNHLIGWRLNVLERVQGNVVKAPENNYFASIEDTSLSAWNETLAQLKDSQLLWADFLKTFNEQDFEKVNDRSNLNYYEHIQGIIQHDAYHLGQIVILAKSV